MFIVGDFVQAHIATMNEIIRVDVDYLLYLLNNVYANGCNGDDVKKKNLPWTKVSNLRGNVIKIQCGLNVSAILTTVGVYTMGDKFGGVTPQLVELANVTDISMKNMHILALTTSGEVYAWGDNSFGQCGVGSNDDWIDTPTRVIVDEPTSNTEDYNICISAGRNYSLVKFAAKS